MCVLAEVAFLGVVDRSAYMQAEYGPGLRYWNILGLRQYMVTGFTPVLTSGTQLCIRHKRNRERGQLDNYSSAESGNVPKLVEIEKSALPAWSQ
jgi:hypothetical protein